MAVGVGRIDPVGDRRPGRRRFARSAGGEADRDGNHQGRQRSGESDGRGSASVDQGYLRAGAPRSPAGSGVLDGDPLDDVGDVLGLVDRRLEETVDLLPLHEVDRVLLVDEQAGDRGPDDPVALVLEPVDLDPVALEALEPLEVGERVVEQLDLLDDDRGLLDGDRGRRLDPVQDEGVGGLLDEVEDVVEAR